MNDHVRLMDGEAVEVPEFTRDVSGHVVDLRPAKWRLNSTTSQDTLLDWSKLGGCDESSMAALRLHIVRLIETNGTAHVSNAFRVLSTFLVALRDHRHPADPSLANLMWHLEQLRKRRLGYQFHYVKQWYISSADRLLEGFDDEVVFALEDLSVGGNAKGFAVLSADPERGPLTEFEETALRQALLRDDGPIEQRAALWLAFAFGTNPANLGLLREEDFIRFHFPDATPSAYFLNIPRIKKRQPERTEFKKRAVDNPLALVIEELIARNAEMSKDDVVRPLFRLAEPRRTLLDGPLADYAQHPSSTMMTNLIGECVARLHVKSPRTGEPLKVTSRRLRYTFASKMVRMGTPARELAELLDHTDTQQVQVYYKADSRFVERLDRTIAENIGPTVRAFMGQIVDRQNRTIDLIPFRDLPELGQCGASFVCGLSAPKNCYVCRKFKAFKDGAHTIVLEELLDERNELLEAGDERMAQQLDTTILAVGEVVARMREGVA
jgi:integrase